MEQRYTIVVFEQRQKERDELRLLLSGDYDLRFLALNAEAVDYVKNNFSNICLAVFGAAPCDNASHSVLSQLKQLNQDDKIPVILFSDNGDDTTAYNHSIHITDVMQRPYDKYIARKRIDNIIELNLLKHQMESLVESHGKRLSHQASKLREQAEKFNKLNFDLIEILGAAIESRDLESGQHIRRIQDLTRILLKIVAKTCPEYLLNDEKVEVISLAASVHDIGKISIPDAIMLKPGRLTKEEFDIMKTHTTRGCELLDMLDGIGDSEYFLNCRDICLYHHERWDGKGYPFGLKGSDIPIGAQVVSVADCYDALTSERPYKVALSHEEAAYMIKAGACGAFSPKLIQCFEKALPEYKKFEEQSEENQETKKFAVLGTVYDSEFSRDIDTGHIRDEFEIPVPEPKPATGSSADESQTNELILNRELFSAYDLVFTADITADTLCVSSGNITQYIPYVPKNYKEIFSMCLKLCHDEDADIFSQMFSFENICESYAKGEKKVSGEFRTKPENDHISYIRGFVAVTQVADNKPCRLIGAFDINCRATENSPHHRFFLETHDELTGLLNTAEGEELINTKLRSNDDICGEFICINIDSFRVINDMAGHHFGDRVLKDFAFLLKENLPEAIIYRRYGDDFVAYISGTYKRAESILRIERLHKALRKTYTFNGAEFNVSVSMGIARMPECGRDISSLFSAAEFALDTAKLQGKNMFAFFNEHMKRRHDTEKTVLEFDENASGVELSLDPSIIPVYNCCENKVIAYDYFSFPLIDGEGKVYPAENYYNIWGKSKNVTRLCVVGLRDFFQFAAQVEALKVPYVPLSHYLVFDPSECDSLVRSITELLGRFKGTVNPEKLHLCIPQKIIEQIQPQDLMRFFTNIKQMGFRLNIYLVGDVSMHLSAFRHGVYERVILASDFVENALNGSFELSEFVYLLNFFKKFDSCVSLPCCFSEEKIKSLHDAGAECFTVYLPPINGVDLFLETLASGKTALPCRASSEQDDSLILRINPERFNSAIVSSDMVIFEWTPSDDTIKFSANFAAVHGYDMPNGNFFKNLKTGGNIFKSDVEIFSGALLAAKNGERDTKCDVRVLIKNDSEHEYIYRHFYFSPSTDKSGIVTEVLGFSCSAQEEDPAD
ncbi:MAG: diguanylate cyclase [Clostridiales bacterium]|nr:diguanylate cyclase [Clostridiales bacterium]